MSADACTMLHDSARPHDGESAHVPVVNNAPSFAPAPTPATPDPRLPLAPIVPHDISATCGANAGENATPSRGTVAVYHDVTDHDARSAPVIAWLDRVCDGFNGWNRIGPESDANRPRDPDRAHSVSVPVIDSLNLMESNK